MWRRGRVKPTHVETISAQISSRDSILFGKVSASSLSAIFAELFIKRNLSTFLFRCSQIARLSLPTRQQKHVIKTYIANFYDCKYLSENVKREQKNIFLYLYLDCLFILLLYLPFEKNFSWQSALHVRSQKCFSETGITFHEAHQQPRNVQAWDDNIAHSSRLLLLCNYIVAQWRAYVRAYEKNVM